MSKKLGFVFRSFPHSTSKGREGLDALLAASAYCEEISVFFIGDGITQLFNEQQPDLVLSRDYARTFKLLELYEIENVIVSQEALIQYGYEEKDLIIDVKVKTQRSINDHLHACDAILTF